MQKTLFEWVVVCNGEEFYLSEAQYKVLLEGKDERYIAFKEFMINPAFVSFAYRRDAEELKKRYPCNKCHTTGQIHQEECPDCKGAGVRLP